ncbi:MAG: tyrosine-type recombinase/integrase [Promethearchaeota archaeon]
MSNELINLENKENSVLIKETAWSLLSKESRDAYGYDYKLFFNFIAKDPKEINSSDILKFIEYLEKKEYKNSSINRKIASLSKMFKIMVLVGEIKANPVEMLKQLKNISHKTSKEVFISLTKQEIKKTVKLYKKSSIQDKKMSLIIRTLAKTGLRISEFINIKNIDIEDYDENNKIITIVGKGKKERKIYIDDCFLKEIRKIYPIQGKSPYLFYTIRRNKYNRKVLWKQIKEKFKEKIDKDVHPHLLRHFFATYKINDEKRDIKAVSKFLGHSSVSTTINFYIDTALDVNQSKIDI